jgi:hypothetical protein
MLASGNFRPSKAGPNLERFGSRNRKHRMTEHGFELVKDRFSQAGGNVADDAGHSSTDRILGILCSDDSLCDTSKQLEEDYYGTLIPQSFAQMFQGEGNVLYIYQPPLE